MDVVDDLRGYVGTNAGKRSLVNAVHFNLCYVTLVGNEFDANDDFHRGPRRAWRAGKTMIGKAHFDWGANQNIPSETVAKCHP